MKRIRAIGMSADEVDKAVDICSKRPSFGQSGYSVTGFAEDDEINQLRQAGLLVEVIPDEQLPIGWLEPDPDDEAAVAGPAPLAADDDRPFPQLADDGPQSYIVQMSGPLGNDDQAKLTRLGVQLGAYVPDFAYRTALSREQKDEVESLAFVRRVVFLSPSLKLRRARMIQQANAARRAAEQLPAETAAGESTYRDLEPAGEPDDATGWSDHTELYADNDFDMDQDFSSGAVTYEVGPPSDASAGGAFEEDLGLAPPGPSDAGLEPPSESIQDVRYEAGADTSAVADALESDPRITRVERGRYRTRIFTALTEADADRLVADILKINGVATVDPYFFPEPLTVFAREIVGIGNATPPMWPWDGTGEVVGVVDTGVDTTHPDLTGRVDVIQEVAPEGPNDPHGHGTHVTSIICGDGHASGGQWRGIAPGSHAIVMSVRGAASDRFVGLKPDLSAQFKKLYDRGCRVINLSYGYPMRATYTMDAFELDTFVFDNPDCLVVVAAGNDGHQDNPLPPYNLIGRTAYLSITSPASAKNVLTVGACCSPRTDGPYKGKLWRQYDGRCPPTFPRLADEPICGDPDVIAAFSSAGPTFGERLKPEIVAPGTAILAARSSQSAFGKPEGAFGGHYAYASGTSQACPVVSGAAILVRQYYIHQAHHPNPSAALLKATLINGATRIRSALLDDPEVGYPGYHQGFGRLDLLRTIPLPEDAADGFTLRFVDVNSNDPGALTCGDLRHAAWQKSIQVSAGRPLSVTLCWTDVAVEGVQAAFDLSLQSPTLEKTWGNPDAHRGSWQETDNRNNVERIVIDEPASGTWTVQVNLSQLSYTQQPGDDGGLVPAGRSQGFSLAMTGQNLSDFV